MKNEQLLKWTKLLFLYVLIFLMLREWILPVIELTNTGHYTLLMLFILICLVTSILNVSTWVSFAIKIVYIVWFMLFIHKPEDGDFVDSILQSIISIFTGDWMDITNSVKSMLFLILLWMTVYLIQHWLTIRRSITFFFIITVLFLALIDAFTTYDAEMSIIRTMVLGLLLTGILFIEKLISEYGMKSSVSNYAKLLVPLIIMIAVSSVFAFKMPKEEASENLPAPINEVVNWANSSLSATGKIGYVENDDVLGGDFEADNAPVLKYEALEPQYLRVESKTTYTGRGWERASKDIFVSPFKYEESFKTDMPLGSKASEVTMQVKVDKKYNFLVQPYGANQVLSSNEKNNDFYREIESGKIRATVKKEPISLLNYEMNYRSPVYNEAELNKSRISMLQSDDFLSAEEKKNNLQVPKNLPDTVKELALDITKDEVSVYDKANAIVEYFKTSGYEYSRENVGFPTGDEDYVARFLFDTKIGYCDNFSTSMAIMMRTIGVPTRWVKGFSAGDVQGMDANTKMKNYVVTNNNAHSWVEVYIPNVGWMPFEPTIGFTGFDDQIEKEQQESSAPQNSNEVKGEAEKKKQQEQQRAKEKAQQDKLKEQEQQKKAQQEKEKQAAKTDSETNISIWLWIIIATVVVLIAVLLFIKRKVWMPILLIKLYNQQKPSLEKAYNKLLQQLKNNAQLKRQEGETLAGFAKRVDQQLGTTDMSKITAMMEQELYNPNAEAAQWNDFKEYWEKLINKTRG